jgi:hypothetical protein
MVHFRGVLVLSVVGRSDLNERCIVKGGSVDDFRRSCLEALIEYVHTVPCGSMVNSDYWGNGQDIVEGTLDSVLHFRAVGYLKK